MTQKVFVIIVTIINQEIIQKHKEELFKLVEPYRRKDGH